MLVASLNKWMCCVCDMYIARFLFVCLLSFCCVCVWGGGGGGARGGRVLLLLLLKKFGGGNGVLCLCIYTY